MLSMQTWKNHKMFKIIIGSKKISETIDKMEFKGWNSRPASQYDYDREMEFEKSLKYGMIEFQPTEIGFNFQSKDAGYVTVYDMEVDEKLKAKSLKQAAKWSNDPQGHPDGDEWDKYIPIRNKWYKKFPDYISAFRDAKNRVAPGRIVIVSVDRVTMNNEDDTAYRRGGLLWRSVDGEEFRQFVHFSGNNSEWITENDNLKENEDERQRTYFSETDPDFEAFITHWTNVIEPNLYFECLLWYHDQKGNFPSRWRVTSYIERDVDNNYFFMAERQPSENELHPQHYTLKFEVYDNNAVNQGEYTWIATRTIMQRGQVENIDFELDRILK
jgi:hypothetical protein